MKTSEGVSGVESPCASSAQASCWRPNSFRSPKENRRSGEVTGGLERPARGLKGIEIAFSLRQLPASERDTEPSLFHYNFLQQFFCVTLLRGRCQAEVIRAPRLINVDQ